LGQILTQDSSPALVLQGKDLGLLCHISGAFLWFERGYRMRRKIFDKKYIVMEERDGYDKREGS
jgi:hypothetical protein